MSYALIPVGESKNDACLDVVFVHGITGDALTTWGAPQPGPTSTTITTLNLGPAIDLTKSPSFWPRWIAEDVNNALQHSAAEGASAASVNVWSLGYPAPLWSIQDEYAYPESLRQAVRPSLAQLKEKGIGRRDGSGVVFITHSLGGLATKAILAECEKQAEHKRLLECTRGVAFLATPHSGTALANLLGCLPAIVGAVGTAAKPIAWLAGAPAIGPLVQAATTFGKWFAEPSNQAGWLERANPDVRDLGESYRKIAVERRIATRAFYEMQPFKGIKPKLLAWVVDASNADPGVPGCHPAPVPGCDHVTMCKPEARDNPMYGSLRDWVTELAIQQRRGTGVPVLYEQLPALLKRVRNEPTLAAINTVPKRLQDISPDGQLRVDFSKQFRNVATDSLLRGELGDLLRKNADLVDALANSDWDLDQLVLFLWLGLQLKQDLNRVSTVLDKQARLLELEGGAPPTVILTYRSVDALREGLTDGLRAVLPKFETLHDRISERYNTHGDCDGDGRTRRLLNDGSCVLKPALEWRKPPKQ